MKLTSTITLSDITAEEQEHILTLFASEDKELSNNRASYDITHDDSNIAFVVCADDGVALRAVLSSIAKTLAIYSKTKELITND